MNTQITILILLIALTSCAGAPTVAPIDDALLAQLPAGSMTAIDAARAARDAASDQYALAKRASERAEKMLEIATAALKTAQSRLEEVTLITELAKKDGTEVELQHAQERHLVAKTEADYHRSMLALRESELELADLQQQLAFQEQRRSLASIELAKAEALQGVDLIATKEIPLKDYRKVVTYHREAAAELRAQADSAAARVDETRGNLEDDKRKLEELKAKHSPVIE